MKSPWCAIVDYGAANRTSVVLGLERAGFRTRLVRDAASLDAADTIVLPGVANVRYILRELDRYELREPLVRAIDAGKPALAICAGFQILFERSDEAPEERGLGVLSGTVRALCGPKRQHIGWSRLEAVRDDDVVHTGWAYFAHGFAPSDLDRHTIATASFGDQRFVAAARVRNTIGVQFHPERSGRDGTDMLRRFLRMTEDAYVG